MSRTFAHRPNRAWFDDPSNCLEHHDHDNAECDLPTIAEWRDWMNGGGDVQPWRCGWELNLDRLPRLCGCAMCTGHHWNREDRRRDRHDTAVWLATGRWAADWTDVNDRR